MTPSRKVSSVISRVGSCTLEETFTRLLARLCFSHHVWLKRILDQKERRKPLRHRISSDHLSVTSPVVGAIRRNPNSNLSAEKRAEREKEKERRALVLKDISTNILNNLLCVPAFLPSSRSSNSRRVIAQAAPPSLRRPVIDSKPSFEKYLSASNSSAREIK